MDWLLCWQLHSTTNPFGWVSIPWIPLYPHGIYPTASFILQAGLYVALAWRKFSILIIPCLKFVDARDKLVGNFRGRVVSCLPQRDQSKRAVWNFLNPWKSLPTLLSCFLENCPDMTVVWYVTNFSVFRIPMGTGFRSVPELSCNDRRGVKSPEVLLLFNLSPVFEIFPFIDLVKELFSLSPESICLVPFKQQPSFIARLPAEHSAFSLCHCLSCQSLRNVTLRLLSRGKFLFAFKANDLFPTGSLENVLFFNE